MGRRVLVVLALGALLGLVVGVVVILVGDDDPPAPGPAADGADHDGDDRADAVDLLAGQEVEANVGDRLELRVEENPSVGDDWEVAEPPDADVARIVDRFSEGVDDDLVGAGHTEVFVLEAVGAGTTTLVLHNCFRCDDQGNTPAEDARFAVDLDYALRITR